MRENTRKNYKIALLISDSHLWGLWLYKALKKQKFSFDPLLSKEINENFFENYQALFVPGGWSKNKLDSLKPEQQAMIRDFVQSGGFYLGICGGASLAGEEGLKLVKITRKKERVPSYSGPCLIKTQASKLFQGIKNPLFYLWFPPELETKDDQLKVLAFFSEATSNAYTSDLCLADHLSQLSHYEKLYGIPLSPERMIGKPLLFEGEVGQGKVLLSLIHFDTPNCKNSKIFWKNLAKYYSLPLKENPSTKIKTKKITLSPLQRELIGLFNNFYRESESLINFAFRNFLFHYRYPFFYQWKRGVRGLELLNIFFMLKEILKNFRQNGFSQPTLEKIASFSQQLTQAFPLIFKGLKGDLVSFLYNEKHLEEKEIALIFGKNKKSYGGLYREVINLLEETLVYLWRDN